MDVAADPQLVERWRELQATYLRTSISIDRELTKEYGIGLSEFEILDLVCEVEDSIGPCRMKDLSQTTAMTQSALSRVVDRLDKAGLVKRKSCTDDRRALLVAATHEGIELHSRAARLHRQLLAEHLD